MIQKGLSSLLVIILSFSLLVIGALAYFYFSTLSAPIKTTVTSAEIMQPVVKAKIASASATKKTETNFAKRLFNPEQKILEFQSLPQEVLDLSNDSLVGLNCSQTFGSLFGPVDQKDIDQNITVKQISDALTAQFNSPEYHAFSFCNLEDGRILVLFFKLTVKYSRNDPKNATIFYAFLTDNKLDIQASFPTKSEAGAPSLCGRPIVYTKSNILYYMCNTGNQLDDIIVERVDLGKKVSKTLLNCPESVTSQDGKFVEQQPHCKIAN